MSAGLWVPVAPVARVCDVAGFQHSGEFSFRETDGHSLTEHSGKRLMTSSGALAAGYWLCSTTNRRATRVRGEYDSDMPAIYLHNVDVTPEHIDSQGHTNNLVYLRWMQDAAVAHSAAQGWDGRRYLELGAGWVVRSHFVEYQKPAFAGDKVIVRTWIPEFGKVTSVRKYRIVRGDDTLVVAETNWAFVDLKRRVPKRVPVEVSSAFEIIADDESAT